MLYQVSGVSKHQVYKGCLLIFALAFCMVGFSGTVLADTLYYGFDLDQGTLSHETSVKTLKNGEITNRLHFAEKDRNFGANDRVYLEIDTTKKNIHLYGSNSGVGSLVYAGPENTLDLETFGKFFGAAMDFEILLFEYKDFIIDGGRTDPIGRLPLDFAALERDPHRLLESFNENSHYASSASETAGAHAWLDFVELGVSLDRMSSFYGGVRYSIEEDGSYFGSEFVHANSLLDMSGFKTITQFDLRNLGAITYLGNSLTGVAATAEVPEPATGFLLLGAMCIGSRLRKKCGQSF